ncbi:MAG: bacteriorhodopsin [Candidatus Competibacteraceae bacterium]|nr:bacteriorhodopsin [Candidatus Competibacteraceae bacterium]
MEFLVLATKYTFQAAFIAMAAGAIYFALERSNVAAQYRSAVNMATLICFIAAVQYFGMKGVVGIDGGAEAIVAFPTELRYVDWLLTTPLLVAMVPIMLQTRGRGLMTRLVIFDIIMITTGYLGEIAINTEETSGMFAWIMFGVSTLAWLMIVFDLFISIDKDINKAPRPIRDGLRTLRMFITFGWAIYPIGFVAALSYGTLELLLLRELIYNFSDVFNKVGYGLVALGAVKQLTRLQETEALANA